MKTNRTTILMISSLLVISVGTGVPAITTAGGPEGLSPASPINRVCLLVDATDSVNVPLPGGASRRDAYLSAVRSIIRAAQRAGVPLVLGRVCGLTETLWNAPVPLTRKDFATIGMLLESALKSCDGRTSAVPSARRVTGTDLVSGLDWLARQADGCLLVGVTDGLHTEGTNPAVELLRALDRVPRRAKDRLWLLGLDEGVRDGIAVRVPHSAGIFDLQTATQQLTQTIMRGK